MRRCARPHGHGGVFSVLHSSFLLFSVVIIMCMVRFAIISYQRFLLLRYGFVSSSIFFVVKFASVVAFQLYVFEHLIEMTTIKISLIQLFLKRTGPITQHDFLEESNRFDV